MTRTTVWRLDDGHTEIFSEMNNESNITSSIVVFCTTLLGSERQTDRGESGDTKSPLRPHESNKKTMASRSGRRGEFPPESKLLMESAMKLDDEDPQHQQPVGPQPRRTSRSNYLASTAAAKTKPKMDVPKLTKKSSSLSTNARPSENSAGDLKKDDGCMVCHRDVDHANLLLCEACNDEYHTYCLNPPLQSVPEGDFFCGKIVLLLSMNFTPQDPLFFIQFRHVYVVSRRRRQMQANS